MQVLSVSSQATLVAARTLLLRQGGHGFPAMGPSIRVAVPSWGEKTPDSKHRMPRGFLSFRVAPTNRSHPLDLNNGHSWVHDTLHFDFRKRRVRSSLKTRDLDLVIQRRDELFARLAAEGDVIEERAMLPSTARCHRVGQDLAAERCRSLAKSKTTQTGSRRP